jgi:predicted RNase H-like HicB family nuclease
VTCQALPGALGGGADGPDRSVEDGEHVATVAEFPSLSWLAPTPVEALAGLANVVGDVLADLAVSGEPIPEPLSERTYSGRFVVRVPAEVHRRLVREAAQQHVSLAFAGYVTFEASRVRQVAGRIAAVTRRRCDRV